VLDWACYDSRQATRGELRTAAADAGVKDGGEAGAELWAARQREEDDAQPVLVVGGYVVSDMEQPQHDASAAAMRERVNQPKVRFRFLCEGGGREEPVGWLGAETTRYPSCCIRV
jgi:hypothetical protein